MTMLGRGRRQSQTKKAEKARKRAEQAAQKAEQAKAEAEALLQEAEEAEAASTKTNPHSKPRPHSNNPPKPNSTTPHPSPERRSDQEPEQADDAPESGLTKARPLPGRRSDEEPERAGDAPESGSTGAQSADDVDGGDSEDGEDGGGSSKVKLEKGGTAGAVNDDADNNDADDNADDGGGSSEVKLDRGETDGDGENDVDGGGEGESKVAGRSRSAKVRWRVGFGGRAYVLVVVNLVLIGLLVWLVVAVQGFKGEQKAVQQVAFAAKQAAEDLSSYDYRTIDADLKRATDHTTGNFRSQFTQMTSQVKPSATQQQAVVEGTAVRTSVESVDDRKAIALVYLNQQTAKAASGQRTPSQYTVRLVMTKVGDRWLVSELQML